MDSRYPKVRLRARRNLPAWFVNAALLLILPGLIVVAVAFVVSRRG
jgi:hypothetical protein